MTVSSLTRPPSSALSDEQQYRLMYAATFLIFLGATAVKRLVRRIAGVGHPAGAPRSLIAEARSAGSSALLFAFMG